MKQNAAAYHTALFPVPRHYDRRLRYGAIQDIKRAARGPPFVVVIKEEERGALD